MRTKPLRLWPVLALGLAPLMTAPLTLAAHADQAMSGMDMGGMKMASKPAASPLSITATINPAIPKSDDNTLDLLVSDAAGKPVTGLKLTASVAMTSMDMGTTRPAFTETGGGHYKATVNFSMDGPWRVVIRGQGAKVAVLDFQPGSKTPWKPLQIKAVETPSATPVAAAKAPATNAMAGMDMSGDRANSQPNAKPDAMAGMNMDTSSGPGKTTKAGSASGTGAMPGMDMGGKSDNMAGMSSMKTGIADMKTATIPVLQEKGTYTATGTEDWKAQAGFGHNAGMVGMMNQMMVGGSGMEGMKMPAMNMKFDEKNYAKPEGDDATDAGDMAGMDMSGGKTPAKPEGKPAQMSGMDMSGKDSGMKMDAPASSSPAPAASATTPAASATTPAASATPPAPSAPSPTPAAPVPLIIAAAINAPKAGDNALQITITDAQGKPVTGAKITTSVAMTSMDMGTTHPAVKEKGNGQYTTTANFSMAGPWRVKVKVTSVGQKPQTKAFDFTAK